MASLLVDLWPVNNSKPLSDAVTCKRPFHILQSSAPTRDADFISINRSGAPGIISVSIDAIAKITQIAPATGKT
jgi:hypothetical protein